METTLATPISVAIGDILPSKTNPRKAFDPAFLKELGDDIRQHGVISALVLRVHPSVAGKFEIVCGEQRYLAAKDIGLQEVPAIVRELSSEQAIEIQVSENVKRRNLTALEESDAYNALLKRHVSVADIARNCGHPESYIHDRLRLSGLVKEPRELLKAGRITTEHAIILARLSPAHQLWAIREQDGGLWSEQRSLLSMEELLGEAERERNDNWYKPNTPAELQAWVDQNIRFDRGDEENLRLFPATGEALRKEKAAGVKAVEITLDMKVPPSAKAGAEGRILTPKSWRRASGDAAAKTCEHSIVGVIAVGPGRGRALRVCTEKTKCRIHWGEQIKAKKAREAEVTTSGETGAERHAREEQLRKQSEERAAREREQFERALPAIRLAIAQKIEAAPLAKLRAFLLGSAPSGAPTDVAKLVAPGSTAEQFLRHLVAIEELWFTLRNPALSDVKPTASAWGVDLAAIIKSANATADPSQKPSKTSKKKKGGGGKK